MSKTLLLLVQDTLLAESYASLLLRAGFETRHTPDPSEIAPLLTPAGISPLALLVDPIYFHPSLSKAALQNVVRILDQKNIPAFGLPTPLEPLARAALKLGIHAASSQASTPAALADAIAPLLETARLDESSLPSGPILLALAERLRLLRNALRSASAGSEQGEHLPELLRQTHSFTLLAGMTASRLPFQLAKALLSAVHELFQPAAPSKSPFRTLAQGLDLFPALLESTSEPPQPPRILVVEDDPNANHLICAAMTLVELAPLPAFTAEEALQLAQSQPPNVVLLDIGLPSMNGLEFCARLRSLPHHRNTPVIFLTGMTDLSHRLQSNLTGGNDFVCKPFNLHELGLKALIWSIKPPQGTP